MSMPLGLLPLGTFPEPKLDPRGLEQLVSTISAYDYYERPEDVGLYHNLLGESGYEEVQWYELISQQILPQRGIKYNHNIDIYMDIDIAGEISVLAPRTFVRNNFSKKNNLLENNHSVEDDFIQNDALQNNPTREKSQSIELVIFGNPYSPRSKGIFPRDYASISFPSEKEYLSYCDQFTSVLEKMKELQEKQQPATAQSRLQGTAMTVGGLAGVIGGIVTLNTISDYLKSLAPQIITPITLFFGAAIGATAGVVIPYFVLNPSVKRDLNDYHRAENKWYETTRSFNNKYFSQTSFGVDGMKKALGMG